MWCGKDQWLELQFDPQPRNFHMLHLWPLKKKKESPLTQQSAFGGLFYLKKKKKKAPLCIAVHVYTCTYMYMCVCERYHVRNANILKTSHHKNL